MYYGGGRRSRGTVSKLADYALTSSVFGYSTSDYAYFRFLVTGSIRFADSVTENYLQGYRRRLLENVSKLKVIEMIIFQHPLLPPLDQLAAPSSSHCLASCHE